jgi:hypothetical protein
MKVFFAIASFFWLFTIIGTPAVARGLSEGATETSIRGTELYLSHRAHKDESQGDFKSALLIYDELLKRYPHNRNYVQRMAHCQMQLENQSENLPGMKVVTPGSDDSEPPLPEPSEGNFSELLSHNGH